MWNQEVCWRSGAVEPVPGLEEGCGLELVRVEQQRELLEIAGSDEDRDNVFDVTLKAARMINGVLSL